MAATLSGPPTHLFSRDRTRGTEATLARLFWPVASLAVFARLMMAAYWYRNGQPGIVGVQLVQAGVLLVAAIAWYRTPPRDVDRDALMFASWLLVGGWATEFWLDADALRVLRFVLIACVASFFILRPAYLAGLALVTALTWGGPTWRGLTSDNAPTIAMGAGVACVAALVLQLARRRIHRLEVDARTWRDRLGTEMVEREKLQQRLAEDRRRESLVGMSMGIAHDLNNLLGPMLGATKRVHARVEGEEREDLGLVLAACSDAQSLCAALLDHTGRGARGDTETRVRDCLESSRAVLSESAAEFGVVLDRTALRENVKIAMPDVSLRRILVNLVRNAAQATASGGPPIEVHASTSADGRWVRLDVADRGRGIPDDARSRIFDPFYTTRRTGRGLGLASVHGLVGAHDGTIEAHAREGGGTMMRVSLPARVDEPD